MGSSADRQESKQKMESLRVSTTLDSDTKKLFKVLTEKANVKPGEIFSTSIRAWINNNLDLLTAEERKEFKHLIYGE